MLNSSIMYASDTKQLPNYYVLNKVSSVDNIEDTKDTLSVNVETLDGNLFGLEMPMQATIKDVKKCLAKQTGAEPCTQTLLMTDGCPGYDNGVKDSEILEELIPPDLHNSDNKTSEGVSLSFCLALTPAQICVRIYTRVHFLPATPSTTIGSIWEQLAQLGASSSSVCNGDGELSFMGRFIDRSKTLCEAGVEPRPIRPEEHAQYSKRNLGMFANPEIRSSTLHVKSLTSVTCSARKLTSST